MDKPDMEWIDKLFNCMAEFYVERWTKQFTKSTPEDLVKVIWQSALTGCSYDEIRGVLVLLRQAAKNNAAIPPHHLEFWAYAKGYRTPVIIYPSRAFKSDPKVARTFLDEIKSKLQRSMGA